MNDSENKDQDSWTQHVNQCLQAMRRLGSRDIAFKRCFVDLTGSVKAALMLSQAWYWMTRLPEDRDCFWKSSREWQEETGLTPKEQSAARENLRRFQFWKEELHGVPATLHFQVDLFLLYEALGGLNRTAAPDCPKGNNQIAQKVQTGTDQKSKLVNTKGQNYIRETTPESTAKSTSTPLPPKGGKRSSAKSQSGVQAQVHSARHFDPLAAPFPDNLDTKRFHEAWGDWCQHRRETGKRLTPLAVQKQLIKCAEIGPERAVAAIEHSIAGGYQGIFEPRSERRERQPVRDNYNDRDFDAEGDE